MSFKTSRDIAADSASIFAAFSQPERLARWWGPAGFSNTFETCEFESGGNWSYVMHGPDGKDYANQSRFEQIVAGEKIVIQHESLPRYLLTIDLEPTETGTRVHWDQAFEKPKVAEGIAHIVVPANEQNLDRLTAEVLNGAKN